MAKNGFQYGEWNSYTLQCGTIMTLISPGDAPCNVAYGSGIVTVNSAGGSYTGNVTKSPITTY